jgi:acetyl-CoA acetyltransferase
MQQCSAPLFYTHHGLSTYYSADLGAAVIDALLARTKIDGAHVDDVIWGCISQVGAQAGNIGRNIVLSSNLRARHLR